MRRTLLTALLLVTLSCLGLGCAQAQAPTAPVKSKSLHLFVIGNSFSGNAMTYLPQIAKEGGYDLTIGRAEVGGAPLQFHAEAVEANEKNPEDPKGKPYNGKSLRELLSAGTWDVVTIQQGSFVSSAIDTYQPYAGKLRDFIKKVQPSARIMMHQTWAYRADSDKFSAVRPNHLADTQQEMWEESRKAYRQVATELNIPLIPVGDAFYRAASDPQWGYKKDPAFDFKNPVFPALPNQDHSLNIGYGWSADRKFGQDTHHANTAGCYLAGLVWYGFLFGESPENVTFTPAEVPADFAAYLRRVATQTLAENGIQLKTTLAVAEAASKPEHATTLTAQADTSVRGGEMSPRNFGNLDILRVRNSVNLINARKCYIRFDLSSLPSPVKQAKSATLALTTGNSEGASPSDKTWTFRVYGLANANPGENWPENATNWDNAPANEVAKTTALTKDAVPLGTFTLDGKGEAGKPVTFSSPELLTWLQSDSDGKATLIITRDEPGDTPSDNVVHIFASKENSKLAGPQLTIGY